MFKKTIFFHFKYFFKKCDSFTTRISIFNQFEVKNLIDIFSFNK